MRLLIGCLRGVSVAPSFSPPAAAAALMLMGADYHCVPFLYAAGCPRYLIAPVRQSRCPTPPEALDDIDRVDEDIKKWRDQVHEMQLAAQREARGGLPLPPQDSGAPGGPGAFAGKLKHRLSGNLQFKGMMMAAKLGKGLGQKRESSTVDDEGAGPAGEGGGQAADGGGPGGAPSAASAVGTAESGGGGKGGGAWGGLMRGISKGGGADPAAEAAGGASKAEG